MSPMMSSLSAPFEQWQVAAKQTKPERHHALAAITKASLNGISEAPFGDGALERDPCNPEPQGPRAVTIQNEAASGTCGPLAKGESISRIEWVAAAITSGGCPSSARAAGPISTAVSTAASRPRPIAISKERSHRSISIAANPASLKMPTTRCSDAKENGPGSSGPGCGSLGACL